MEVNKKYLKVDFVRITILLIMSYLLSEFDIFSQISDNLKKKIKYFHVFNSGRSVLFVTIDDSVYGFGDNWSGKLGFGHQINMKCACEIVELKNQGITQFHIGGNFVIASSINNKIFAWGKNDYGRLGCPYENKVISKPCSIKIFDKVKIKQIDSYSNTIAILMDSGKLYAWGDYGFKQLDDNYNHVISPIEIMFPEKVKIEAIFVFDKNSFAISNNGNVYIWGENYYLPKEITRKEYQKSSRPRLIQSISNVKHIGIIGSKTYFLTNDNKIFNTKKFHRFDEVLYKIKGHITRMITFKRNLYGMTESWFIDETEAVYKIYHDENKLILVENSIFDWFARELNETFETIELK